MVKCIAVRTAMPKGLQPRQPRLIVGSSLPPLGLLPLRYASNLTRTEGKPFFLNYGLHRPHLPFHFPASFGGENIWEKYGKDSDIALPLHEEAPDGMPGIAFTYELDGQTTISVFGETAPIPGPLGGKGGCPFCGPKLPDNMTRIMRKG